MKATLRIFFDRLLGLAVSVPAEGKKGTESIKETRNKEGVKGAGEAKEAASAEHATQARHISSVRLTRLPFFLAHIAAYMVLYIVMRLIQMYANAQGQMFTIKEFGFTAIMFILTVILLPIYVRRAHDLGWSLKKTLLFSVLPAFLRLVLLIIPLIVFKYPESFMPLMRMLPIAGILYWIFGQVQVVFVSVLMFAPGTDTHNRFGTNIKSTFTLGSLYGMSLFSSKKTTEKITDTSASEASNDKETAQGAVKM